MISQSTQQEAMAQLTQSASLVLLHLHLDIESRVMRSDTCRVDVGRLFRGNWSRTCSPCNQASLASRRFNTLPGTVLLVSVRRFPPTFNLPPIRAFALGPHDSRNTNAHAYLKAIINPDLLLASHLGDQNARYRILHKGFLGVPETESEGLPKAVQHNTPARCPNLGSWNPISAHPGSSRPDGSPTHCPPQRAALPHQPGYPAQTSKNANSPSAQAPIRGAYSHSLFISINGHDRCFHITVVFFSPQEENYGTSQK